MYLKEIKVFLLFVRDCKDKWSLFIIGNVVGYILIEN